MQRSNHLIWGIINGFLIGAIPIVPYAFLCAFDNCKGYENLSGGGTIDLICVCKYVNWFLPLESLIIVASAICLLRLIFPKRFESELLFWQIVGIFSFFEYFFYRKLLFPFVDYWRICHPDNTDLIVCEKPSIIKNLNSIFVIDANGLRDLIVLFTIIISFNLFFGFALSYIRKTFP